MFCHPVGNFRRAADSVDETEDRWRDYFLQILNRDKITGIRDRENNGNERVSEQTSWREVEEEQITGSLEKVKDKKISGLGGIVVKMLKYADDSITIFAYL